MSVNKANLKDCTVYLTRQLRRGNEKRIQEISDKCLLCGKCEALCQVGVEGPALRIALRSERKYALSPAFKEVHPAALAATGAKVMYYGGCMSQLVPSLGRSVTSLLEKAGVEHQWMDRDGGICCGRPMLTAGRTEEAERIVAKNTEAILASGAEVLLVSCPICYRMFREKYSLPGIRVVHYVAYFQELLDKGVLKADRGDVCYVYHDPCELGRGCGIYEEPRRLLGQVAGIAEAPKSRQESICCGGSLGSLSLGFAEREKMTRAALDNLYASKADAVATACPLCQWTFSRYADRPVRDIAEVLDAHTHGKQKTQ